MAVSPENTFDHLRVQVQCWEHEALGGNPLGARLLSLTFAWHGVSSEAFRFSPTFTEDFVASFSPAFTEGSAVSLGPAGESAGSERRGG